MAAAGAGGQLVAADRVSARCPAELRDAVSGRLGYYTPLQSINSEDAITWSFFGPLMYGPAATRAEFLRWLLGRLELVADDTVATIDLWRRIPHPEKPSAPGPELDALLHGDRSVVFVEAKWGSPEGVGQGPAGTATQIKLPRSASSTGRAGVSSRSCACCSPATSRRLAAARRCTPSRSASGLRRPRDGYRAALVDERDVDDVALAAPRVGVDLADLRAARRIVCGPVFALSAQVGGADADVIAGDLLVDFKATSTTSVVSRAELWQLAGYALADADDQYGIRRVGIAALRWRRRWTIDLDELLERLAGQPFARGEARAEFAAAMRRGAARRRPRRRAARGHHRGDAS